MGTYTDTYVEMLQQDLQFQYRKCFEVGTDLVQALQASEAKGEELTAIRRRLNLQMDTTAQVEKKLVDALGVLSDRDIEVERLTFALKDKDNELESVRDEHRTQIDGLMGDLDEIRQLFHNSVTRILEKDEEIERLTRKNKKRDAVALLSSIDELWTLVKIHKEDLAWIGKELAAQGEMVASIQRHDGLISKAFGCIDNHSDSIYKQQQSIDNLRLYVQGIAAHINTGSSQENP